MNYSKFRLHPVLLIIVIVLGFYKLGYSQTTNITGVINSYLSVTSIASGCGTCSPACSPVFTLSSVAGLSAVTGAAGNKVLIIQMQAGSSGVINSGAPFQFSNTYGQVSNYGGAGNYEFALIASISGSTISFTNPLVNNYDILGKVQVIPVPVYVNANTTGIVTGTAWNGTVGGVLVFECSGTLTQNHNITMDGLGFRGGACKTGLTACCNTGSIDVSLPAKVFAYYWDETTVGSGCSIEKNFGANKGEGVFPFITTQQIGRGAFANGGGGGSGHNSGGGGGANGTSGGKGGVEYFLCTSRFADDMGGIGGYVLQSCQLTTTFMGGGGGAGHNDNGNCPAVAGGNGGGIIIISSNTLNTTAGTISSRGTTPGSAFSDGAAGGGAGGSVFLKVTNYAGSPIVNASGGNGGNNGTGSPSCHAPGGGGGAGVINVSGGIPGGVTFTLNGGIAGTNNATCGGMTSTGASNNSTCSNLILNQNSCSLPVTLLDFVIASASSEYVILEWQTISEIGNDYFEIERSNDLISWEPIGKVKGKGNSNVIEQYSYTDNSPSGEIIYYRLKQIDIDSKIQYSIIREANLHSYKSWINVYISSETNTLDIQLFSDGIRDNKEIEMYLYDALGRLIAKRYFEVISGITKVSFPVNELNSGIYILKLNSDEFKIKMVQNVE